MKILIYQSSLPIIEPHSYDGYEYKSNLHEFGETNKKL